MPTLADSLPMNCSRRVQCAVMEFAGKDGRRPGGLGRANSFHLAAASAPHPSSCHDWYQPGTYCSHQHLVIPVVLIRVELGKIRYRVVEFVAVSQVARD